jgi:hypothetical protein
MGGFQFQESHPKMVSPSLPMSEDDILPNHIDTNRVDKLNRGIPFRRGQKMHVSTLKALIHLYIPLISLVITMNSSTNMSSWLFFASLKQQYVLPDD